MSFVSEEKLYEGGAGDNSQSSEIDQMEREFKEFQRQQALKREREKENAAYQGHGRVSQSESAAEGYRPPHVRNPNLSIGSIQKSDDLNGSRGDFMPSYNDNKLQSNFVKEPKSAGMGRPDLNDDPINNFLQNSSHNFQNESKEFNRQVKANESRGPPSINGDKEHLSFGGLRNSNQQPLQTSMRASGNRDMADPYLNDQRDSIQSNSQRMSAGNQEDSQNFGAMQNPNDRQKLEDFMNADSTSIQKANQSFTEDGQKDNQLREFSAARAQGNRPASRAGSDAGSRAGSRAQGRGAMPQSLNQSRQSNRGGAYGDPVNEIDHIVVEKSPRQRRASNTEQKNRSNSRGRGSAGSLSSIGKGSNIHRDMIPFVDEKLSNINDTRMSNALQPKRNQDNNQSIHVLANVFDQIDPINVKDTVKKINESLCDMQNDSRISVKDQNHQNSKENHNLPSNHGNDTGNFAAQSSNNNSKSMHNQSRGMHDSRSRPVEILDYQPRETFNPNDFEKLRIDQSLDKDQIVERAEPQLRAPPSNLRSRIPTEEEIANMDKKELERLMEDRMDQIMAQQRQAMQQPNKMNNMNQQLRHQTPFFRDEEQIPSQQEQSRNVVNNSRAHQSSKVSDRVPKYEQIQEKPYINEEASFRSNDRNSSRRTPKQQAPEEYQPPVPARMSHPKEASESIQSAHTTDKRDREQFNEQFKQWQQLKQEEMQLKQNNYFDRQKIYHDNERAPSRQIAAQAEYEMPAPSQQNHSFSNNTQPVHDPYASIQQPIHESPMEQQYYRPLVSTSQIYKAPPSAPQHEAGPSEFRAVKPTADPFQAIPASRERTSSVGSRMSRAGRTQKYADGRQSRSGSRHGSQVLDQDGTMGDCEISKVSIIKSPKQSKRNRMQEERDASMDMKRRRMQEDMAKAQEAQRQLEEMAKRKRQEEQKKLFKDIEQTKFGRQVLPQQRQQSNPVVYGSRPPQFEQEADDFGDDEFNDIDEGTIRKGGPQNHRRNNQNQGALNQRNMQGHQQNDQDIQQDDDSVDTRRQLHRGNNRGVKILQISNKTEQRQDQMILNGRQGPKIVSAHDYQPPQFNGGDNNAVKQNQYRRGDGSPYQPHQTEDGLTYNATESLTRQMTPLGQPASDPQQYQKQQQLEGLFNSVMREKDPKQALHQYVMRDKQSFDMYKDSVAQLNNRIDRELSKVRRQQNTVADRLIEQRRVQDQNLQKYQDHLNQQRMQDQMKECSFQPQIAGATNTVGGRTNSRTRHASPAQFAQNEQAFVQKKQNWINEQNALKDQEFQRMQQTKFVNDGSRRILQRRGSNASGTITNQDSQRPQSNSRGDSRASNGSNQRSDALNNLLNRSSDRKFNFFKRVDSRARHENSRGDSRGSGRSGSNSKGRIPSLAQYSGVEKRKLDSSKSPLRQNAQQQQNLPASEASDNYLTMQMHREFQDVIQHHIYEKGSLHIEDILLDMGFIDEQIINNQKSRLGIMLRQQRNNLLLCNSQGGMLSRESDEITQNLFKVLCSIMNLKAQNCVYQPLDGNLLNSYLGYIDLQKEDQDILILEQLATVKSLINRQPFGIPDNQVLAIHKKFMNLYHNRKNSIQSTRKQAFENRAADQQRGMFQPQIDYKSAQYKPQTNVYERSQNYQKKMPDRDPRDIEYEKQQQHCTFKPMTNKGQGRPWQGNRPPSRAGSGARGSNSRGRGRPDSGASGSNASITRQRFGPTVQTQPTTVRNDSGVRGNNHPMAGQHRRQSPANAVPRNQFIPQPARANNDPEPFSESDPSFKQTYLKKNVEDESESSLSLNPQKFHDRQVKHSKKKSANQAPEYTATIDDPDTYIGARETYKDDLPQGLRTPGYSGGQTPTQTMPRPQAAQQSFALNQSAMPSELLQSSTAWPQRYEHDQLEQAETNSMVNDSFGPATMDQQQQQHDGQDGGRSRHQKSSGRDGRVPICVLKIELERNKVEEVRVYEGEDPAVIVGNFGQQFNLTEGAMHKLHQQILEQIKINQSRSSGRHQRTAGGSSTPGRH